MKFLELCCYVGCKRSFLIDLDLCGDLIDQGDFQHFSVFECEGRIFCTEDCLCPWHGGDCIDRNA